MRDLLEAATPDALLDFLEEYARRDPRFENALRVQFAQPDFDAELDKLSGVIDAALVDVPDWDKHDKWGWISIDTGDILFEVGQRAKQGHIRLAFAALETLYRKLVENFEYQSECELSMEAEDCLRRMRGVAAQAVDPADREYIFEHCIELADLDDGRDYGAEYEDQLLAIAASFATPENRRRLEKALARHEDGMTGACALIHLTMVRRLEGDAAAELFINAHLDIEPIRKIAVDRAMEQQDYAGAETLCDEYIRQHDGGASWQWPKDWYVLLFSIHEKTGDFEKQLALARKLLLDKHEYGYYAVLKNLLIQRGDWANEYPFLREQCAARLPASLYMQMLREESETALLLVEVRKEQSAIFTYGAFLADTYPAEAYCIFRDEIKEQSELSSHRGAYQEVCKKIQLLADAGGRDDARALIDLLRQRNTRRPAFLDELRKIEREIGMMGGKIS